MTATTEGYDDLLRLAELFERSSTDMRDRAGLGERILADPGLTESEQLAPTTYSRVDTDVSAATTGRNGLLARSVELDADALVVRATVRTYRWIDDLQDAAYRTMGSIAGRAIGYLAPEVALGGAVVSAGLIETDALDRDDVTAYLGELAENNPDLMEHVTGGGLVEGLLLRSVLTARVLADRDPAATRGGLRAIGADPFPIDIGSALRDTAGGAPEEPENPLLDLNSPEQPTGLEGLITTLHATTRAVTVHRVSPSRFIAYLPGLHGGPTRRLRLVGGDHAPYAEQAIRAIDDAVRASGDADARVLIVGYAQGGVVALDVATQGRRGGFVVDQVVTAGAPSALVPRVPPGTRMLALEDRSDPVALLGSLVNASSEQRLTVVFDAGGSDGHQRYVHGGRAVDNAPHPELRAELARLREAGFLAS